MKILNWGNGEVIKTTVPLIYIHGSFADELAVGDKVAAIPNEVKCGSQQWPVVDAHFKIFYGVCYGTSDITIEWVAAEGGNMKSMTVKVDCVKDDNKR